MRLIDADVLISLLNENVEHKQAEVDAMQFSSDPKVLVKQGHLNGLEAAINVAERLAHLTEEARK